ncbi:MAG: HPr kinase/phosphorylase [Candidatus Moanabacter tarae]|uniref:HPr kinase/phosphorylase n=1 Tax=Candidatus Moanibacter tarae TaxID=2200854 RepID=A0A2Z4AEQ4_9BACT|nr:MAG: HPr kinase/phosphorylase [Candidatus Moanabacter tarae]|tara:strand:+ start:95641 stop:96594 length:954 start_codon:yes stop_codon:yes gene_type:complete
MKPRPKIVNSISVEDFYNSFKEPLRLKLVAGQEGMKSVIRDRSVNRPSLCLAGSFKHFGAKRVQLFGAGDMGFMRELSQERQQEILHEMVARKIPCIIVSRNLVPSHVMFQVANKHGVPLLRSALTSHEFTTNAVLLMEDKFAPCSSEHGTMMDVKGIGTLIRGGSGIGKSECALGLIEKGHSLVADDLVYIRLIKEIGLMARSSDLNRGYMECRGLGIINVADIFGVRAIRLEKKIDLVVSLIEWESDMAEERTGLDQSFYKILGTGVPEIQLTVRPGRDLAHLVEIAAMVHALKGIGHHGAQEFNDQLMQRMIKV